jgi:hypothetical protein
MDMDGFAIVELMGHRRFGARVSEVEVCGVKMLRAVVCAEPPLEQLVHPQAFYAITPCTEEQAKAANTRWVLEGLRPALPAPSAPAMETTPSAPEGSDGPPDGGDDEDWPDDAVDPDDEDDQDQPNDGREFAPDGALVPGLTQRFAEDDEDLEPVF